MIMRRILRAPARAGRFAHRPPDLRAPAVGL